MEETMQGPFSQACPDRGLPDRVGSLGKHDILPACAEAKEGSLLIADKPALVIRAACIAIPAPATAVHLSPARDEPRLHASFCQASGCLHAISHSASYALEGGTLLQSK